jgi:hypothetical protein
MSLMKQEIILLPLEEICEDSDFVLVSKSMGFYTLDGILAVKPETLIEQNGFTYHWLAKLTGLLKQHGLTKLLQPVPGRNVY